MPLFQNLEAVLRRQPCDIVLILKVIEGTSGINQQPSRTQSRKHVRQNPALTGRTEPDIIHRPLGHRLRVLAEHPFPGARHIGHNHIETSRNICKIHRIIVSDNDIGGPPLGDVLTQHGCPGTDDFVAHQKRCGNIPQHGQQMRGLAARSSTQVQHGKCSGRTVFPHLPHNRENPLEIHGRSLLDVICAGMKERIQIEFGTGLQETAPLRECPARSVNRKPGQSVTDSLISTHVCRRHLERIEPYGN